jgi:hypothetical protein
MVNWWRRDATRQQDGLDSVNHGAGGGGGARVEALERAGAALRTDVDALERRLRDVEAEADERTLIHAGYVERLNRLVRRLTKVAGPESNQDRSAVGTTDPEPPVPPRGLRGVHLRRWMRRAGAEAQGTERTTDGAPVLARDEVNGGE